MMLVGWPRIVRFLGTGCRDNEMSRFWRKKADESKEALLAAGVPVFHLPELDDEARAMTEDLLRWMKRREVQRRAETGEN